jgi:hypothetical protein
MHMRRIERAEEQRVARATGKTLVPVLAVPTVPTGLSAKASPWFPDPTKPLVYSDCESILKPVVSKT